jgi:hypothetical protein
MKLLTILILLITVIGCGKEQNSFEKSLRTQSEIKSLNNNCSKADFHKNLAKHANVLATFECLGWKEKYPRILAFIKNIDEIKFNKVFKPLNDSLFSSTESRDNFLSITSEYVNLETGEEITSVIDHLLSNREILNSIKLLVSKKIIPNKKTAIGILNVLEGSESKNSFDRVKLSNLLGEYPKQKEAMKNFVQEIVELFAVETKKTKRFIERTFDSNEITKTLSNLSKKEFSNIFYYPIKQSSIIENSRRLKEIIQNNEYACREYQDVYVLKQDVELVERMNQLKTQSHQVFLKNLFDLRIKFVLYNNICPYPELNNLVSTFLDDLIDFTRNKAGFEILQKVSIGLGENKFALFDYIGSNLFRDYRDMLLVDEETRVFEALYPFVESLDKETFENVKIMFELIFEDETFTQHSRSFWIDGSKKNKDELISGLVELSLIPYSNENILSYASKIQKHFKTASLDLTGNEKFVVSLLNEFQALTKNRDFKDELLEIFSVSSLFRVFDLINSNSSMESKTDPDEIELPMLNTTSLVNRELTSSESKSLKCLERFHELLIGKYDFWEVLELYPTVCISLNEEDKEISNKIFEWTFNIDSVFSSVTGGKRFSIPYGVISGEMMRYYHSLIQLVNKHLDKENPAYISEVVDLVKTHLYEYNLLGSLEISAELAQKMVTLDKSLADNVLHKVISADSKEFENSIQLLLGILEKTPTKVVEYVYRQSYITPEVGEKEEMNKDEALHFYREARSFLLQKNNTKGNLLYFFTKLLHPKEDYLIPYGAKKTKPYILTPEKLVSFLFDISNPDTKEKVKYEIDGNIIKKELNLVSRLELVIREISFLDNFYGAFFINKVASAKEYTKNVKSLKKNVTLLEKTGGAFRRLNLFPRKTKWAFRNIKSSYDSLWQLNSGDMKHGDLIQSVLSMAVRSSDEKSQSFSPYRKPKVSLVQNHNGRFITLLTQNSVLTHISGFLRNNYMKDEVLDSLRFQIFNENFLKSISFSKLYDSLEILLKHENNEMIFQDFYSYLNSSNKIDTEIGVLMEVAELITSTYQNNELDFLPAVLPLILDNYKLIKESLLKNIEKENLSSLRDIVSKVNQLAQGDKDFIMHFLINTLQENDEKETITNFMNADFLEGLSRFLVCIDVYTKEVSNHEPSSFLKSLINDEKFSTKEVHELFVQVFAKDKDFEYFYGILNALAAKENGKTGVSRGLDELFLKNNASLKKFLLEIFARFQLQ